jgi:hypothetical protein
MIKFMQCIRRKPQISVQDFRQYWDRYTEVWQELARLSEARRMAASVALEIDQNTAIQLARGTGAPFDGVLEVWWSDGGILKSYAEHPTVQEKLLAMRALQEEFADLGNSSFFFASETEHVGPA